jgi:hypothetical protein
MRSDAPVRSGEDEEDEEGGSVASDLPEPPFTWRERYSQCVDVFTRDAPGWFAFAIILFWVANGIAHRYGWYDLAHYGNVETEP